MTTKKSTKKPASTSTPDDIDAFAHHLSEALRLARTSDSIPGSFYNNLVTGWNDCMNDLRCYQDATLTDAEEYIRLALRMEAGKGGAR